MLTDLFKPFDEEGPPKKSGGIDFRKLCGPEGEKRLEEIRRKYKAKADAIKFQAEYLMPLVEDGTITNAWECSFLHSIFANAVSGVIPLTDKQEAALQRVFDKY